MRNISIRWQLIGAFTLLSATLVMSTVTLSAWEGRAIMENVADVRITALRDSRMRQVGRFLGGIETHLQTLASTSDLPAALAGFSEAANLLPEEMAPNVATPTLGLPTPSTTPDLYPAALAELTAYYEGPFADAYTEANDEAPSRSLRPTDPIQVWMQAHYISQNPNPLGEKDALSAAGTGTSYDSVHEEYQEFFRAELERYDYHDIFLVDAETHRVVYSVYKDVDFGTDLSRGPYSTSGLAEAAQAALVARPGDVVFADFAPYEPSYGAPAGFMGIPIVEDSRVTGALVVQFPVSGLNDIMAKTSGLGETGRSFVVGGDDLLARTQLRHFEENTVLALPVDTDMIREARNSETPMVHTESFDGREVLAAAAPVDVLGTTWILAVEVDKAEEFGALNAMVKWHLAVSGLLILLGLLGGYFLSRSIAGPIAIVSERMTRLADGKFAPAIDTNRGDEVGQLSAAYNQLSTRLQAVIRDMQSAAVGLSGSSEKLMQNVQAQQSGATEQAAAVEQTKQSVHVLLQSANSIANLGKDVLVNAEQAQSNASVIGSRIHELSSNSANITEILGLIKDIANKSEMLALNAALEGTKAGDAGRGFSLVATQMQRLAEQVMGSAKRIEALTSDINTASAASVLASEEAAKLALETTRSAQEITSAVSAQQAGTTEVDAAMDEVNEVARRSVDVAREMVDSANSLHELSDTLQEHVALFDFSAVANVDAEVEDATSVAA